VFTPPAVSLPKGGGAIRGIGEKLAANAVTGTASMSVPIAASPGRSGFGPQLSLSYDSGRGNGPFGFGWSLSLPAVTRKTDKGLPRYDDAAESDVFLLSDAEDLVPALAPDADAGWTRVTRRDLSGYRVDRYRPRVEGLFARIERWTRIADGDTHWRSITRDNVTTRYGEDAGSRIADPADPGRVFAWLICSSHDDRGNAAVYEYAAEDGDAVDTARAHERHRTAAARTGGRHLKRIRYGNRVSHLVNPTLAAADWMFELVFDYGDHDAAAPGPRPDRPWPCRDDPFSSYRAGFEVRTYRLCRRVLMFHHFPDEPGVGADCLVRSTEFGYRPGDAVGTFLTSVTQHGHRRAAGGYLTRSLPPIELEYSPATLHDEVREIDPASLAGAPAGLAGPGCQWVDLDGEGVAGILSEQASAWFFKPNLGAGRFGPPRPVDPVPMLVSAGAVRPRLLDLAGDGRLDVVALDGPVPGRYERRAGGDGWDPFAAFAALPAVDWNDPNLRLVDLDGDGHADVLVTEQDAITWYPSRGEDGFGAGQRVSGPRVVFADPEQSIHLADMSGDGLTDLVRVRNGEVSYWPNLGHGRFGARVAMDDAPWFDRAEAFDQRFLRLVDVDGSGVTDLVYLGAAEARIWLNRSGNGWSAPRRIAATPATDGRAHVAAVDLFGTGTACLVWSSDRPGDERRSLRYVDLLDSTHPHLLVRVANNLGAETHVRYTPSTRFYLDDRAAGRPWKTRLPFPVQVVERVETYDRISHNRFVTRYAYHDGFFDGDEREFRGFGMVEQLDTEELSVLGGPPASNEDPASHVPPVQTKTWFHTGVADGSVRPDALRLADGSTVPHQPGAEEFREAYRALKGSVLRQEVYALDGSAAEPHPYTVAESSHTVEQLQPRRPGDRHAVFFAYPRETVTYHYERVPTDPRVAQELTLDVDGYGNVLRSATVAYGRRTDDPDLVLTPADQERQRRTHVVLAESRFTNAVEQATAYRTPQPAASRMYELLGLARPEAEHYRGDELAGQIGVELPYAQWDAAPATPARRLVEHVRTRYRRDDLTGPLPPGALESMALPFETYRLALPDDLQAGLYGDRVDDATLAGAGGYVHEDGGWWLPSGRVSYAPNDVDERDHAGRHFFMECRLHDPFGATTEVDHDRHDLLVTEVRDPLGNRVAVDNDYRVLQPRLIADANGDRTAAAFDALGMVAGAAVMGRSDERLGDSLDGFDPDPDEAAVAAYLDGLAGATDLLRDATTRLVYDLHGYLRTRDDPQPRPVVVATVAREQHSADLPAGRSPAVHHGFTYSDGFGREIQRKAQAEPGPGGGRRWAGTGWTVFDNKGNPVRRYEPFFTDTHRFEFDRRSGVGSVLFYDPMARVVATLHPNDTWEKSVIDAWHRASWDVNDTVLLDPRTDPDVGGYVRAYLAGVDGWQGWHARRAGGGLGPAERAAAEKAAAHADTPGRVWLDALGRPLLTVAALGGGGHLAARARLDVEGNEREAMDAMGRLVIRQDHDMLGRRLRQSSMDAGERLLLYDIAGRAIRTWNGRGFRTRVEYDALRRPLRSFVAGGDLAGEILEERVEYGEGEPDAERRRLRGRVTRQFDAAGVATNEEYDFKGNLLRATRRLAADVTRPPDWAGPVPLEPEVFTSRTAYDALDRPVELSTPDGTLVRPRYNEANLLERLDANLHGAAEVTAFVTGVEYNARAQRVRCSYGNGTVTEYDHDPLTFRVARLRTRRGAEAVRDLAYTYDPAGNVTAVTDTAQQAVFFRNRLVEPTNEYTYDAVYRLVQATGREHLGQAAPQPPSQTDAPRVDLPHPGDGNAMGRYRQRYAYDDAGNVRQITHAGTDPAAPGWTRAFAYDEPSPLEPDRPSNRLTAPGCTYDAHGNLTGMPELPLMAWNHQDQLRASARQVVTGGGVPETTHYVYDASGQRVRKVTNRAAPPGQAPVRRSERFYLGGFEIHREYDAAGNRVLERQTLHMVDGDERVALVETRTTGQDDGPAQLHRYQVTNHLGSATLELDADARIVSYEEFYPYGSTSYQAVRSRTETPKRYRYTGKERDEESGLCYHGARYYAPWLARWTNCDPAGLADGLNLYAYVRGNPVSYADPTGMWSWKKWVAIGVAVVVGTVVTVATAGLATPLVGAAGAAIIGGAVGGAAGGAAGEIVEATLEGRPITAGNVFRAALIGGVTGGAFAGLGVAAGAFARSSVGQAAAGSAAGQAVRAITSRVAQSSIGRPVGAAAQRLEQALRPIHEAGERLGHHLAGTGAWYEGRRRAGQEIGASLAANPAPKGTQTVAAGVVDVPGYTGATRTPRAMSREKSLPGHSPAPEEGTLTPFQVGEMGTVNGKPGIVERPGSGHAGPRAFDAERKLLEEIQSGLPPNATGTVDIGASRDACPSCLTVMFEFQAKNPGLRLILHGGQRPPVPVPAGGGLGAAAGSAGGGSAESASPVPKDQIDELLRSPLFRVDPESGMFKVFSF
jgi:RHS repeat-associated protein